MKRFKKLLMDVLGFSRTETNGSLILILIVVLTAVIPRIFNYNQNQKPITSDDHEFIAWIEETEEAISIKSLSKDPERAKQVFKEFDPNTADLDDLLDAGLPTRPAKNIIAYRSKGGYFMDKSSLKKIYGITDELYDRMEPFVRITKKSKRVKKDFITIKPKPKYDENWTIDLNKADTSELRQITGVGRVLSERIAKYRSMLGGFHDLNQLSEVFGLNPETILEIKKRSTLSPITSALNINKMDSIRQLTRHPYVSYNLARAILNYKRVHGDFESSEDLRKLKLMNDSLYQKIEPYLSL